MTDWIDRLNWIKHDGGPQPVTDDVFVAIVTQKQSCRDIVIVPAGDADWQQDEHAPVSEYAIVNQHLIDAAISIFENDIPKLCESHRLSGIRLGLEAADKAIEALVSTGDLHIEEETALEEASIAICTLNSEAIAKEADNAPR